MAQGSSGKIAAFRITSRPLCYTCPTASIALAMARTKAKSRMQTLPKAALDVVVRKVPTRVTQPYDARRYAGTVPAFASVGAEEMKAWRDLS
jgi:hypothetical protein